MTDRLLEAAVLRPEDHAECRRDAIVDDRVRVVLHPEARGRDLRGAAAEVHQAEFFFHAHHEAAGLRGLDRKPGATREQVASVLAAIQVQQVDRPLATVRPVLDADPGHEMAFLVPILGIDGERTLGEKALFQGVGCVEGRAWMLFHAVFVTIRGAQGNAEEGLRGITHVRPLLFPGEVMACPVRRKAPD